MNYNNSALRLRNMPSAQRAAEETVVCVETDKRGTHLRVRKVSTILRKALRPVTAISLAIAAFASLTQSADAQFIISTGNGVFVPSFRDTSSPFDDNNTTWFGWGSGTFDLSVDNELIDNPPVNLGLGGIDGTLNQVGTDDILSSSNNIYTSSFENVTLSLAIPTNGIVGTGFTTIIIQGRTAFGGFGASDIFGFPTLGGDTPDVVVATNAANQGQFWAKYEIPGNAASYDLNFDLLGGFVSLATVTVDTQWSATAYAPDTAQAVPEPSSFLAAAAGVGVLGLLRRRRAA